MGFYSDVLFPKYYDRVVKGPGLEAGRERWVPRASGRVLEIGIGTGLNLPHYTDAASEVHGIDPNRGMLRQLSAKIPSAPCRVSPIRAGAERLPFRSESFDTVLSTHTLCSVPQLQASLAEVHRVLRPGGRFLFVEHGLSPDPKVARWQRRLNRLQQWFAVGCKLDLRVADELRAAGFELAELSHDYAPDLPRTHGYMYEGVATR